ncbi:MAG: hypothetical protein UR20_C0054G0002 [Candidatus Woesebacteria bacterium GW2011_GWE2_31_6]|nr:MAG: hypothetical protein UR20_C0054G0002 [Candidatus Woesebacteria bacterium GW2011_GWE2_31_6]
MDKSEIEFDKEKVVKRLLDEYPNCPKCGKMLSKETLKGIGYPYVCLSCNENFYRIEVE